jgi:hypothetical protein
MQCDSNKQFKTKLVSDKHTHASSCRNRLRLLCLATEFEEEWNSKGKLAEKPAGWTEISNMYLQKSKSLQPIDCHAVEGNTHRRLIFVSCFICVEGKIIKKNCVSWPFDATHPRHVLCRPRKLHSVWNDVGQPQDVANWKCNA